MMTFLAALVLIPVVDQTIKQLVRHWLGQRALALGLFGQLRVVQSEMWTLRLRPRLSFGTMWLVWGFAATASALVAKLIPSSAWAMGLLVGAALSHAIETTARGSICDYVCLRFWPAFNLADAALTIGALGVAYELLRLVSIA
jgi:lipoprotein signal peptidase